MSAARLILRTILSTVTVIVVGTILVVGFTILEPFNAAFGSPPAALGWDDPNILAFALAGGLGLLLVLIIWYVGAPIRRDQRQQYR